MICEVKVNAEISLVCNSFRIFEGAAHNVPDAKAESAAKQVLKVVGATDESDLVIALVSGGGSALLPAPADGITLNEKRHVSSQ